MTGDDRARKPESVADDIISSLGEMRDALRDGEKLYHKFTMRTVELELDPREFSADQVKSLRNIFRASQAVFARLIGIKVSTLRNWEQGRTNPPPWACRLLELMSTNPEPWQEMLEGSAKHTKLNSKKSVNHC